MERKQEFHALVFRAPETEQWLGFCLEYEVATHARTREEAFDFVREAVELHLETTPEAELVATYQAVGSEPEIRRIEVDAPALLNAMTSN